MTSHEQDERGQTLLGSTMLILESPIPTGQERGAELGAGGHTWESPSVPCPGDNVPFSPPAAIPLNARFPLRPGSPSLSQNSFLQPAPPSSSTPPRLDRQEGLILAASRESCTTPPC